MNDGHCFKFLLVPSLRNISREREKDMSFEASFLESTGAKGKMVLKGDTGKVKTGSGFTSYVWVPSLEEQIESLFQIGVVFVLVTIKQKTYCGQCPARFTLEP
ncbi:hypothetical protein CU097_014254 [Rhizopus azygosporus]|uniref:Uncharacterized protein n=1 Tax=Rhizopus azygosporus TaxID=86630 RepID=A0A367K643_RHIAZ|nr:hypothetical protein CU097_014254 [Rhizopus azygosporus]